MYGLALFPTKSAAWKSFDIVKSSSSYVHLATERKLHINYEKNK